MSTTTRSVASLDRFEELASACTIHVRSSPTGGWEVSVRDERGRSSVTCLVGEFVEAVRCAVRAAEAAGLLLPE